MQFLLLEILSVFKIFHEHWEPTYPTLWVSSWYCWQKHELYIPVLFNGSMLIFSLQKMFIQKLLDILFVIKIKLFKIKLCYLSIWLLLLKALAQIHYRFQNISICEVDAVTVYCISTYHQNWHDKLQLLHLTLNKKNSSWYRL